jgi:hypothetical protein
MHIKFSPPKHVVRQVTRIAMAYYEAFAAAQKVCFPNPLLFSFFSFLSFLIL